MFLIPKGKKNGASPFIGNCNASDPSVFNFLLTAIRVLGGNKKSITIL